MKQFHKKRLIMALLALLVVFVLVFFMSFHNYLLGEKTLAIGLNATAQNLIIMGFSVLSLVNIIVELRKVD
jgi:hypothetical protein